MVAKRRQFITDSILLASSAVAFPHVAGAAQSKRIKIGQIGTAHAHASGKMSAIRSLPEIFEVVGIVEPDKERRKKAESAAAYQGLTFLEQDQLLNTPGLAAVAVETEIEQLTPTAIQCLKAGMHVHVDKPAGTTMTECHALHDEATRQGKTVQMGYMLRYNPAFELLFQVIRDGWLGNLTELSGTMGKYANDATRKQLAAFPGGGMFELACHLIDAMVTVLGKPDQVTPYAFRSHPEKDTFADNQLATFHYPNLVATIRCNHIDPFGGPRRAFEVAGEAGLFQIQPLEPGKVRLGLTQPHGPFKKGFQNVPVRKTTGRYDDEFRDLAKIARGEKELAWDSKHDLAVHEAVLLASGMPIN
ncbi:putative oxidoreductase YhhX [Roseimaritima multifibrata]|uniref:Putative oxidoreductase YhhX n=1 Tax=Roseimaritima multifibrata TaxID=1930274 RepID=A0A517MLC9_9BACT|nr:Gfo/Idh/MocA family oxidoreductase [Roseimaritima multifibrata]QDS95691.1 putative oxidoreductase YhhX [Roseimaritima multifibrata]